MTADCKILIGDCIDMMRTLPDESVNCCVTSPPYFGLRDYGHPGQIGLEPTPDEFVAKMVAVFGEVRRVLRDDGTLWLNLGDSYAANRGYQVPDSKHVDVGNGKGMKAASLGLKPKDLVGIPWRVAFALQQDGWYLRQDIIWHKPNPMPESVTDRCTKAHEYLFLLSKSERYYFDSEAIKEPSVTNDPRRSYGSKGAWDMDGRPEEQRPNGKLRDPANAKRGGFNTRNRRSVWTVSTQPYKGAHFATFPPALIRPCIRAGCPIGGAVLDPFGGSGTTGMVALEESRNAILCELNPEYAEIAKGRTNVTPGLGI